MENNMIKDWLITLYEDDNDDNIRTIWVVKHRTHQQAVGETMYKVEHLYGECGKWSIQEA